jgi:hypothetical protein
MSAPTKCSPLFAAAAARPLHIYCNSRGSFPCTPSQNKLLLAARGEPLSLRRRCRLTSRAKNCNTKYSARMKRGSGEVGGHLANSLCGAARSILRFCSLLKNGFFNYLRGNVALLSAKFPNLGSRSSNSKNRMRKEEISLLLLLILIILLPFQ